MDNFKTSILIILITLQVCSCAIHYVDDSGNHKIIGLVNTTLNRPHDSKMVAGDKVTVTNIGMMYTSNELTSGLSIGYNSETFVALKNDMATIIKE